MHGLDLCGDMMKRMKGLKGSGGGGSESPEAELLVASCSSALYQLFY